MCIFYTMTIKNFPLAQQERLLHHLHFSQSFYYASFAALGLSLFLDKREKECYFEADINIITREDITMMLCIAKAPRKA